MKWFIGVYLLLKLTVIVALSLFIPSINVIFILLCPDSGSSRCQVPMYTHMHSSYVCFTVCLLFSAHLHGHAHIRIQSLEGANHEKAVDLLKGAQGTVCTYTANDWFPGKCKDTVGALCILWRHEDVFSTDISSKQYACDNIR